MKAFRWIVVLGALVAVIVVLRLTVLAPKPVAVRVAEVDRGLVEETVTNTRAGTVKVRLRAKLSPQIGGLVVALPHAEGQAVSTGDLLLKLDDRLQRAELELAQRAVRSASAQADEACLSAELAEKELKRVIALHAEGIASEQNLDLLRTERDRSRAACEAARAARAQAEAQVSLSRVQLEFAELRAPFAGTVAEVSTEVGEWITPSPPGVPLPPVIDLLDPTSLYVSAPIDEVDAERVRVGQVVRLTVDSRPDVHFSGRLSRVAPYVLDELEQNRTVEVEAEFMGDEAVGGILPGTSADAEIILEARDGVLRIPASSVSEDGAVLVLSEGQLEERRVEVGLRNWQYAEVLDGLAEGESVVIARDSTSIRGGARAKAKAME